MHDGGQDRKRALHKGFFHVVFRPALFGFFQEHTRERRREEALLFLHLGGLEERWRVSEIDAADLISALNGACPGVQRVVLDPFPAVGFHGFPEVPSLHRKRFLGLLATPR
jgi:hypothetical protein